MEENYALLKVTELFVPKYGTWYSVKVYLRRNEDETFDFSQLSVNEVGENDSMPCLW